MSVSQLQCAAVCAGLVRGVAQDQHLLRSAGQILAAVSDSIGRVSDLLNRRVDVQPPLVALWRAMRQIEPQVAQILITSGIFFVAGPQRNFVELQVFVARIAEDHGAEPPIADRECLALPVLGRLIVVQGKPLAGRNGNQGKGGEKCTGD